MRKRTPKRAALLDLHPRPQRPDSDLPDGRAQRLRRSSRSKCMQTDRRVHLDARRHRVVRQRPRRGRGAPLHRRDVAAVRRCARTLCARSHEYSWHTPGHTGGTAFLKSPVGRVFYDYFGENMLRSDLSISVGELGSLLDHTGPIGESEKYAARVFGAHRTYCVTNGTSTSNRLIFTAAVDARSDRAVRSQLPQVDRARPDADRRHPDLLRASAQSLGNHRPDPSRPVQEGVDQEGDRVESAGARRRRHARRSTAWSRIRPTTGFATTRSRWRSCSTTPSIACIGTRRGTATRASIRSIATGTACAAIRRTTPGRPCSRRIRRTNCSRRCRRRRSCTSATAAARFRMRASTSRS